MTMSELRAQIVNLLQDAWELGYECGAKEYQNGWTKAKENADAIH